MKQKKKYFIFAFWVLFLCAEDMCGLPVQMCLGSIKCGTPKSNTLPLVDLNGWSVTCGWFVNGFSELVEILMDDFFGVII